MQYYLLLNDQEEIELKELMEIKVLCIGLVAGKVFNVKPYSFIINSTWKRENTYQLQCNYDAMHFLQRRLPVHMSVVYSMATNGTLQQLKSGVKWGVKSDRRQ